MKYFMNLARISKSLYCVSGKVYDLTFKKMFIYQSCHSALPSPSFRMDLIFHCFHDLQWGGGSQLAH